MTERLRVARELFREAEGTFARAKKKADRLWRAEERAVFARVQAYDEQITAQETLDWTRSQLEAAALAEK